MAIATSTARREAATVLSTFERSTFRNALLRLDGHHGPGDAAHARRVVELVLGAIRSSVIGGPGGLTRAERIVELVAALRGAVDRRVGSATGSPVETAEADLIAALNGQHVELADELFPAVAAADRQWSLLVGLRVGFERHCEAYSQYVDGVVIGLEWNSTGPRLRVSLTCAGLTCWPTDVVSLSATRWACRPSPDEIVATASRTTRCRAGRPLYETDEVPAGALSTRADLALHRRRPATLQPPVATVRHGKTNVDLYAIADSADIPTTARNRVGIAARRTCAQCGATSPTPFAAAKDDRRYCPRHIADANQRVEAAITARNRAVSTVWAREVTNDPTTVLVVMLGPPTLLRVRVEDIAGNVLLNESISEPDLEAPYLIRVDETVAIVDLPDWVRGEPARQLAQRRSIMVRSRRAYQYYNSLSENEIQRVAIRETGHRVQRDRGGPRNPGFSVVERPGDNLSFRHQVWEGKRSLSGLHSEYRMDDDILFVSEVEAQMDLAETIAAMRQQLFVIAATELSDEQVACATVLNRSPQSREFEFIRGRWDRKGHVRRVNEAVALFGIEADG